jgi:hypothetical protein
MIRINLEDTYEPKYVSEDFTYFIFESELYNNDVLELHVIIEDHPDKYLPNVFNLGFGPPNIDGTIDDKFKAKHKSINKLFSSILLYGILFLNQNKDNSIGIDGSDDLRAYLYHRMFRYNISNLENLSIVGVDWYVKLLRNKTDIERDENGYPLFKPRPEVFDKERNAQDLYRYYIYKLN